MTLSSDETNHNVMLSVNFLLLCWVSWRLLTMKNGKQ